MLKVQCSSLVSGVGLFLRHPAFFFFTPSRFFFCPSLLPTLFPSPAPFSPTPSPTQLGLGLFLLLHRFTSQPLAIFFFSLSLGDFGSCGVFGRFLTFLASLSPSIGVMGKLDHSFIGHKPPDPPNVQENSDFLPKTACAPLCSAQPLNPRLSYEKAADMDEEESQMIREGVTEAKMMDDDEGPAGVKGFQPKVGKTVTVGAAARVFEQGPSLSSGTNMDASIDDRMCTEPICGHSGVNAQRLIGAGSSSPSGVIAENPNRASIQAKEADHSSNLAASMLAGHSNLAASILAADETSNPPVRFQATPTSGEGANSNKMRIKSTDFSISSVFISGKGD